MTHRGGQRSSPVRQMRWAVALFALVGAAGGIGGRSELAAQGPLQVLASGLDNPRGLAFGPDGALYVVEAGRGGTSTLCAPAPDPPFAPRCYGPTGAITRITGVGVHQRVVTGLPSIAGATGQMAQGPNDIDFGFDRAWLTVGFGGNPANRAPLEAAGIRLGALTQVTLSGQASHALDLSAYEVAANPDGLAVDSNPVAIDVVADGAFYVDAGANAVMRIDLTGAISTMAVFPNRSVALPGGGTATIQSVPTAVVAAPDGTLYVSELSGFPFVVGAARVYRVPPGGGTPVVAADGFTMVIDIAVDARGNGYVLEFDTDGLLAPGLEGRVTRIGLFGERTVLASTGLIRPGGIAIGPDGAVYVTTGGTLAGGGGVVRIPQ